MRFKFLYLQVGEYNIMHDFNSHCNIQRHYTAVKGSFVPHTADPIMTFMQGRYLLLCQHQQNYKQNHNTSLTHVWVRYFA